MLGCDTLARARGDAEIAVLDHRVERIELRERTSLSHGDALGGGAARGFTERFAQLGQRALDAAQADFPGLGQRNPGASPQQQRRAEVALQAGDGLRHGGL